VHVATTQDTSQAIFYQLQHGFTCRSLGHIEEYRQAYITALDPSKSSLRRSLHIDPLFEFWRDPDQEEDLADLVVTGLASGDLELKLQVSGDWVLGRPDEDDRLALARSDDREQAIVDAVRRLRADAEACRELKQVVRTPSMGDPDVAARIQGLISSFDADPAKGRVLEDIRTRLQRYVDKLAQTRTWSYADETS
jgi:hypothetical protein